MLKQAGQALPAVVALQGALAARGIAAGTPARSLDALLAQLSLEEA